MLIVGIRVPPGSSPEYYAEARFANLLDPLFEQIARLTSDDAPVISDGVQFLIDRASV